jgi:GMP synthase-like glutamine amidotransferase
MNTSAYIAVVDPAVHKPELECLNQMTRWTKLPLSYHLPKILGTHTLTRLPYPPAAIVILGSASSVNDGFDWQKEMNAWLLPMMNVGIPTLGLCYGHQLICHLYGSKVGYLNPQKEKLRGIREVVLKKNALWGAAKSAPLVVTHCEVVEKCPEDFDIVGTSREVPIDAVAHRSLPIWGFQPHPEATPHFFNPKPGERVFTSQELEPGHRILQAFFEYVAERE